MWNKRIKENACFICLSTFGVQWSYENHSVLPKNINYFYLRTMCIQDITAKNKGVYECAGTAESGGIFYAQAKLKVIGY